METIITTVSSLVPFSDEYNTDYIEELENGFIPSDLPLDNSDNYN